MNTAMIQSFMSCPTYIFIMRVCESANCARCIIKLYELYTVSSCMKTNTSYQS